MSEADSPVPTFKLIAGWLCLDFTNNINYDNETPNEQFTGYSDLVAWSRQIGAVTPEEAVRLQAAAVAHPDEAAAALARALALRDALHQVFAAVAAGRPLETIDLAGLNALLPPLLAPARLGPAGNRFAWEWASGQSDLERPLWPVARSAADLLTAPELQRVGECAGEGCGWLFLDTSRSGRRRWCDMKDCGNRAKARRFYYRKKSADPVQG